MTCVAIGPPVLPKIPDFLLTAPVLTLPFPVGIDLPCCKFDIMIPGIDAALAAANAAISAVTLAGGIPVITGVMTLNTIRNQIQSQLDALVLSIPRCPVDGATLGG